MKMGSGPPLFELRESADRRLFLPLLGFVRASRTFREFVLNQQEKREGGIYFHPPAFSENEN